ncbi:MAG: outer membrane beta-barrel protein [Bacteroidales bacterium]
MRKIIITFCMLFLSTVYVYSQTGQGTMYLGGSFNLGFGSEKIKVGSNSTDGPKSFNFGINPSAGYFISDNFMIGLGIGYDMESVKEEGNGFGPDETKLTVSAFNIGPYVRYYMMPVKNAGVFVQGGIGMGFGKTKEEETDGGTTTTEEIKMSAFVVGITPGIVFFVGEKVAFEATFGGLNFVSATNKQDDGDDEVKQTTSNFNLDINPGAFTFGVAVHL